MEDIWPRIWKYCYLEVSVDKQKNLKEEYGAQISESDSVFLILMARLLYSIEGFLDEGTYSR